MCRTSQQDVISVRPLSGLQEKTTQSGDNFIWSIFPNVGLNSVLLTCYILVSPRQMQCLNQWGRHFTQQFPKIRFWSLGHRSQWPVWIRPRDLGEEGKYYIGQSLQKHAELNG